MTQLKHIAAIDAGSNAIRVVVASASAATGLQRIESERIPVRLGRRAFTYGELDEQTIEAAAAAFARIRALFERHRVEHYRAVGTSALRTAQNRDTLLRRIAHESDIELDIIDGEEEARLVRLAVLHAFSARETPSLLFDLGGGSLEVEARRPDGSWWSTTRPIGTVRLLETFGLEGAISEDEARMVKRYARTLLHTVERQARPPECAVGGPAVACGGNAEAIAQVLGDKDERGMPIIEVDRLRLLVPSMLEATVEARMQRFGVTRDRSEVMPLAALVFGAVAKAMRIRRFWVPGVGVREGLLMELGDAVTLGQSTGWHAREQSVLASARNFAARLNHNPQHGEHVRRLARLLFDQVAPLFGLPAELGLTLELAALLHDVGDTVNRRSHHKHSEYLIRWGRIPGLEPQMRDMVASIARAHRKSPPDAKKPGAFADLDNKSREYVRALTAILRIADSLDTDHSGRVKALGAKFKGSRLRLTVYLDDSAPESLTLMLRKGEYFEEVFGVRLDAEIAVLSTSAPRLALVRS